MSITIALEPHKNPRIDALTVTQRLRWVLEFIRRDLGELTPEELAAIGDDLVHATAPWWVEKKPWTCMKMSAAEVRALQQEIHDGVNTATGTSIDVREMLMIGFGHEHPHGGWVLPDAPEHLVYLCYGRHARDGGSFVSVRESTNDRMAILNGVIQLLRTCGNRFRLCEVCRTPFVRQYRQEYCSVRCGNKVRNKRRLEKKTPQRQQGMNHNGHAARWTPPPITTSA
jgi:hypothetical protein